MLIAQSSIDQNIISAFLPAAAADAIALVQDGKSISYRQLQEDVAETAGYYRSRGIATRDMVLVFVPMSLPLYRIVPALFYLGASPVFLDEWVSIGRLKECLKVVPCKAIIAHPFLLFLSVFIAPLRRISIKIAAGNPAQRTAHNLHHPADAQPAHRALCGLWCAGEARLC